MKSAAQAYAKVATEMASPRALEADLLLRAAAKLQGIRDNWDDKKKLAPSDEAIQFNGRLWTILLDSVTHESNQLPQAVRDNLTRLGVYIMAETFSLMTKPKPEHLERIIKVNRSLAAGLRGRA